MSRQHVPSPLPAVKLDRFALDVAARLLGCLDAQLALTSKGPTCRSCLYPGDQIVPMDVCCECADAGEPLGHGMAAVRVYRIFPMTGRLPQQDYNPRKCTDLSYGVTLEMVVYRCMSTIDAQGNPPSCDQLTADTVTLLDDAAAMRTALRCCFGPLLESGAVPYTGSSVAFVEDDWNPIGPAGGCGGGRQRVTVQVYDCDCSSGPCPPGVPCS